MVKQGGEMKMRRRRSRKAALALTRRQEMAIASCPLVSRLVALFGSGEVSRALDEARAAIKRVFSVIKREWLCR